MTRNLKMLGLALVAVLAMGAVLAQAASALPLPDTDLFVSEAETTSCCSASRC